MNEVSKPIILSASLVFSSIASMTHAQSSIYTSCAVVVASDELAERLEEDPYTSNIEQPYWIAETRSGTYVATIGIIDKARQDETIASLAGSGLIPNDSICLDATQIIGVTDFGNPAPIQPVDVQGMMAGLEATPSENESQEAQEDGLCLNYMSMQGLCWNLSSEQMQSTLTMEGYSCEPYIPTELDATMAIVGSMTGEGLNVPEHVCTRDHSQVLIYRSTLLFNCGTFNGCSYTVAEIAQMIVDNGVTNVLKNQSRLNSNGTIAEKYCGRSPDGQILCVSDWNGNPTITLEKGAFGEAGVDFQ